MPKLKQTTKKVARSASRARRISHPPLSTFNGTFIPSNAWHVKLGIDDGRAAVVFVVIVGILLLGLVGTILAWAKTVTDLRGEVIALRAEVSRTKSELARLTEPTSILIENFTDDGHDGPVNDQLISKINQKTGVKITLVQSVNDAFSNVSAPGAPGPRLRLLSNPPGSDAAYVVGETGTIYRLDLKTNHFSFLYHAMHPRAELFTTSPDGHYVAYHDPNCSEQIPVCTDTALIVLNLETDERVKLIDPKDGETLCNIGTQNRTAHFEWTSPLSLDVQICRGARERLRVESVTLNPVGKE